MSEAEESFVQRLFELAGESTAVQFGIGFGVAMWAIYRLGGFEMSDKKDDGDDDDTLDTKTFLLMLEVFQKRDNVSRDMEEMQLKIDELMKLRDLIGSEAAKQREVTMQGGDDDSKVA